MTREEEIEKASSKYIENYLKSINEYPLCDNRKRMSLIQVDLYKMQEAFENGMKEADKTMLDRACSVFSDILIEICPELLGYGAGAKAWENEFRKRLEGGAE